MLRWRRFGDYLVGEKGRQAKLWKKAAGRRAVMKKLKTEQLMSTAFRGQTDGEAERHMAVLGEGIRLLDEKRKGTDWFARLQGARGNHAAFEILYGFIPASLPLNANGEGVTVDEMGRIWQRQLGIIELWNPQTGS